MPETAPELASDLAQLHNHFSRVITAGGSQRGPWSWAPHPGHRAHVRRPGPLAERRLGQRPSPALGTPLR